jgi:hypothetical protein
MFALHQRLLLARLWRATTTEGRRVMAAFDKKQMDAMVNRFLGWRLPQTFGPDCFVTFDRDKAKANQSWPVGTNLLTADEARAMLEYVLDVTFIPDWSLLEATQGSLREHMLAIRLLIAAGHVAQEKVDEAFKIAANLKSADGVTVHADQVNRKE